MIKLKPENLYKENKYKRHRTSLQVVTNGVYTLINLFKSPETHLEIGAEFKPRIQIAEDS